MTTKHSAAVALGKLGGAAKVPKGLARMPAEKRAEIQALALKTRRANAAAKKSA